MRTHLRIAGVAALASLPVFFGATAADAYCGKSVKDKAHPRCVTVIRAPLPVRTKKSDTSGLICHFRKGRSFWAPRGAGTADGTRWYSVKLRGVGTGYFSETRNGHMTIRGC